MQQCLSIYDQLFGQVYLMILCENNVESAQLLLQKLSSVAHQYISVDLQSHLSFAFNRAHAL